MESLEKIQDEKSWSCEEIGKEFAELLIKEPPAPMMMNDYYEDYG